MPEINDVKNLEQIYSYQMSFLSPYFFPLDFTAWERSFTGDIDGQGRVLFKELYLKAAYDSGELIGFIQYGRSAFGFDDHGDISSNISYPIIRNLYFDRERADAGRMLLRQALAELGTADRVYAFFHYFGMSCFARHGKLFEQHGHIDELLKENGFVIEHENVYYSSVLSSCEESEARLIPQDLTAGGQQYIDFTLSGKQVGGCELHYIDPEHAYLRWIYINGDITGRGIGTTCMKALKQWLRKKGIVRFDTDTALSNLTAQHYYEKTGFTREGITRSYYLP